MSTRNQQSSSLSPLFSYNITTWEPYELWITILIYELLIALVEKIKEIHWYLDFCFIVQTYFEIKNERLN